MIQVVFRLFMTGLFTYFTSKLLYFYNTHKQLLFFVFCRYYTERFNPDLEMAQYYQDIPSSMWITLLNLSGECPLCDFTAYGKIITGCIGIFAVGLFGVPIGKYIFVVVRLIR